MSSYYVKARTKPRASSLLGLNEKLIVKLKEGVDISYLKEQLSNIQPNSIEHIFSQSKKNSKKSISKKYQNYGFDRVFIFEYDNKHNAFNAYNILEGTQYNHLVELVIHDHHSGRYQNTATSKLSNNKSYNTSSGANSISYMPSNATVKPNDPMFHDQWALKLINAPVAWSQTKGSSLMKIAVIDSGFDLNHEDLKDNLIQGMDIADGDYDPSFAPLTGPYIEEGFSAEHGTMVAGILAAKGNNNIGMAGTVWNAQILPIKSSTDTGAMHLSDLVSSIYYAINQEARVINITQSFFFDSVPNNATHSLRKESAESKELLRQVIQVAIADGIAVVAAAGNESTNLDTHKTHKPYPACLDGVICVGAVDHNLKKAKYSNFGSRIDIWAPGGSEYEPGMLRSQYMILAPYPIDQYRLYSGTSSAAPMVSGVIAAMLSKNPRLRPSRILQLLKSNAQIVEGLRVLDMGKTISNTKRVHDEY